MHTRTFIYIYIYIYAGPGDLAADMGLVREHGVPDCWGTEAFANAEKRVAAACKANGKIAGYWNSDLEKKSALGFSFFVVDGDLMSMQMALSKSIAEKRERLAAITNGAASAEEKKE